MNFISTLLCSRGAFRHDHPNDERTAPRSTVEFEMRALPPVDEALAPEHRPVDRR
jgi:hypothetical protein